MPQNEKAPKWEYLGTLHKNELPVTKIMDEISAIKVSLVSKPNKEELYKLFKNVANVSWDKSWNDEMSYEESVDFLSTLIKGGMLPLALEMNNFTFLIENITRITTHALVRGRVGMTYAQQSTGNADQRHSDILIPRSFSRQSKEMLPEFYDFITMSKLYYAKAVDNGMSVQEARCFLPTSNANKLYISMNLASLINFYSKRSDRTEEYMQGNEICRQIKEIFNIEYPELAPVLRSACGKSCAHSKNSPFVNGVYFPSKEDDVFDWNPASFLYQQTRDEMCWNENSVPTVYFVGSCKVTEEEYNCRIVRKFMNKTVETVIKLVENNGVSTIVRGLETREIISVNFQFKLDKETTTCSNNYIESKLSETKNQFEKCVYLLSKDRNSRQAIIQFNQDVEDDSKLPNCFVSMQFLIRDDLLFVIVFQRSLDVIKKFPIDIELVRRLAENVANETNSKLYQVNWMVGSAHYYIEDVNGNS